MSSICIVVNSLGSGGAERIATNIAIYYHERGHKVTVLAFRKEGQYLSEIPRDINIIGLKSKAGKRLVFEIVPVLRRVDADIIISANRNTNIIVGVTSFFYRARIIFREANTLNEIDFFSFYGRLKLILLMRFSYLFADRVIANSEDTKNDLLKYEIVSRDKVKVVGNPVLYVGAKEKSKEKLTHKWLGNKEYKTILNVGRLHKQKNQRLLLEAFSEVVGSVNNARLIILGEGEEKEGLIKLSKKLKVNDHVDFVGFQKNPFPYYKSADLFVLSSSWEGFGNVLVEAMSVGTPVISTNCPGGPKMILENGRFGVLVPTDSKLDLAESIVEALNNPLSDEEKRRAVFRAWEFSLACIADKYISI